MQTEVSERNRRFMETQHYLDKKRFIARARLMRKEFKFCDYPTSNFSLVKITNFIYLNDMMISFTLFDLFSKYFHSLSPQVFILDLLRITIEGFGNSGHISFCVGSPGLSLSKKFLTRSDFIRGDGVFVFDFRSFLNFNQVGTTYFDSVRYWLRTGMLSVFKSGCSNTIPLKLTLDIACLFPKILMFFSANIVRTASSRDRSLNITRQNIRSLIKQNILRVLKRAHNR